MGCTYARYIGGFDSLQCKLYAFCKYLHFALVSVDDGKAFMF